MRKGIVSVFGLLALVAFHIAPAQAGDTVYYYYNDAQGSPVAVTDANGNVIERTQYAPYGQVLNRPEHDGPGYTKHEEDAATGLTNMQQRYDDKAVGRMLGMDPVDVDPSTGANFNRYWYANDNPYRYTDPDGRDITEALGGVFYQSYQFVTGNGFDGGSIAGALKDGYNGEGGGVLHAALEDANTAFDAAGAAGAIKGGAALLATRFAAKEAVEEGATKGAEKFTKEVIERKAPGGDGASSKHIIEKLDGKTNSVTHQVTKDGEVIHQHQTHIGKEGTERQFPDKWVEHPKVPKEDGG